MFITNLINFLDYRENNRNCKVSFDASLFNAYLKNFVLNSAIFCLY